MKIFNKLTENEIKKYFIFNICFLKTKKGEINNQIFKKLYFFGVKVLEINKDRISANKKKVIYLFGVKIYEYKKAVCRSVINKGDEIFKQRCSGFKDRISVFLSGYGAVAEYQTKLFSSLPNNYDIFVDCYSMKEFKNLNSISKNHASNIIPYANYDKNRSIVHSIAKIFVLADSEHHINSLNEAIKTKGESNRYILLPEPVLIGLFFKKLSDSGDSFKDFMLKQYPMLDGKIKDNNFYEVAKTYDCYFIKPLIELTGITNFIVYTNHNKNRILKEVERENIKINVKVINHSYERLSNIGKLNIKRKSGEFIIGTFGGPSYLKQTKEIIEAVDILNKEGFAIKLVISGFMIDKYISKNNINTDNLIVVDSKNNNKKFLEAMNSVDLAIQFRPKAFSASSGCVAELFGLKKEILVNEGFVPEDIKQYFNFAPDEYLTPQEIANIIKDILVKGERKMNPTDDVFKKYSFENVSKEVYDYVKKTIE